MDNQLFFGHLTQHNRYLDHNILEVIEYTLIFHNQMDQLKLLSDRPVHRDQILSVSVDLFLLDMKIQFLKSLHFPLVPEIH